MTETRDLHGWADCVILDIYRQAILLGLPIVGRADEPVMEQVRPNIQHIQDLARYEHTK